MFLRWILRAGFGLLYNQFAWAYDMISWTVSIGQWRTWQRQALPYVQGRRILEIAHGTGNLQIDLQMAGHAPLAFDLSPAMSRIARRKLARHNLYPPFVRGRAQALPFSNECFSTIVSTFPTEFIADPESVREFYRALEPGGRVVFVPAATIIPAHLADRLAQWLFEVIGQSTPPALADVESWPPRLAQTYQTAGFKLQINTLRLPRSIVWVVVAEK